MVQNTTALEATLDTSKWEQTDKQGWSRDDKTYEQMMRDIDAKWKGFRCSVRGQLCLFTVALFVDCKFSVSLH